MEVQAALPAAPGMGLGTGFGIGLFRSFCFFSRCCWELCRSLVGLGIFCFLKVHGWMQSISEDGISKQLEVVLKESQQE